MTPSLQAQTASASGLKAKRPNLQSANPLAVVSAAGVEPTSVQPSLLVAHTASHHPPQVSQGQPAFMFECSQCQRAEFDLMVRQTNPPAPVAITTNPHGDIVITVGSRAPFVADLGFMNRFAQCQHCQALGAWRYQVSP